MKFLEKEMKSQKLTNTEKKAIIKVMFCFLQDYNNLLFKFNNLKMQYSKQFSDLMNEDLISEFGHNLKWAEKHLVDNKIITPYYCFFIKSSKKLLFPYPFKSTPYFYKSKLMYSQIKL